MKIHRIIPEEPNSSGYYTNTDGAGPGGLVLSGNTLYGTASGGGLYGTSSFSGSGGGTVFMVNTDGTGFTTLYDFAARPDIIPPPYPTNIGGAAPVGLMLSGNMLYGMAGNSGAFGGGTVFSISLPVSPPQLALTSDGVNVILTWPTNFTGFTLQSSSDLSTAANWLDSTATPTVLAEHYVVTSRISAAAQFYRLKK